MADAGKKKVGQGRNLSVAAACVVFVGSMVGMSYASVPLYRLFCQLTGYNGTVKRVEQYSDRILDKSVTVTFDANTAAGLDWDFKPEDPSIDIRIGETVQVNFTAENKAKTATKGQAVFNVTPMGAAAYFNKVQCFCFTETTLKPGEKLEMPVVFYVDPAIVDQLETKDIGVITLSYTFYPHDGSEPIALVKTVGADKS